MTKVAVLGGGPAGLAAAWYLAEGDPTLEITVYQQGWRLGGKGASSRGPAGRIEEHGIHLFGNFYGNALGIVRQAHAETGRSLSDELLPNNLHLSLHPDSGRRFSLRVAQTDSNPPDDLGDNIRPDFLIRKLYEAFIEAVIGMSEVPRGRPRWWNRASAWLRKSLADGLTANVASSRAARRLEAAAPSAGDPSVDSMQYREALDAVMWLKAVVKVTGWMSKLSPKAEIRHAQVDLLYTALKGARADRVFERGIDTIDHLEHRQWLRLHGASERTLKSPVARSIANICFQFRAGDTTDGPDMSAAAFLMFLLRQLAAPGPNFWYFRRGTGESVILPIYEALAHPPEESHRRPVKFEFFTRVTDVISDTDDEGRAIVSSIELRRHARPLEDGYDPIVDCAGLRHWPAEPVYDRLHPDDRDRIRGRDLEDWYAVLPDEPGTDERLELGRDFDIVVMAIPPPAHPWTCPSLLEDQGWRAMVDGLEFIATQGVQLWLDETPERLGLPGSPYRSDPERWSTAEWFDPFSCWVDYSDLIQEETWGQRRPRSLVYFCGPLPHPDPFPDPAGGDRPGFGAETRAEVERHTNRMLLGIEKLLPGAVRNGAFDYDRLVDHDPRRDTTGPERLKSQYLRANVVPTERYGLARPNDMGNRRSAWESGLANLVLAGDWTNTGFNINSFEGAAMSGALASFAVIGTPDPASIIGYDFLRPTGGPRPPRDWQPIVQRDLPGPGST